jgi:hypothetical protein
VPVGCTKRSRPTYTCTHAGTSKATAAKSFCVLTTLHFVPMHSARTCSHCVDYLMVTMGLWEGMIVCVRPPIMMLICTCAASRKQYAVPAGQSLIVGCWLDCCSIERINNHWSCVVGDTRYACVSPTSCVRARRAVADTNLCTSFVHYTLHLSV